MANYTAKLVDRTSGTSSSLLQAIQRDTQSLFDEAFDGTGLQVAVSWGTGADIDNYVVHFVEDKTPANSYCSGSGRTRTSVRRPAGTLNRTAQSPAARSTNFPTATAEARSGG